MKSHFKGRGMPRRATFQEQAHLNASAVLLGFSPVWNPISGAAEVRKPISANPSQHLRTKHLILLKNFKMAFAEMLIIIKFKVNASGIPEHQHTPRLISWINARAASPWHGAFGLRRSSVNYSTMLAIEGWAQPDA